MNRNTTETYSDLLYGSPVGTHQNNCYAWAINYYRNSGDNKLQPGDLAGMTAPIDLGTCKDLVARALKDAESQGWKLEYLGDSADKKDTRCSPGSYKIAAVLAKNEDFHWYRHHRDLLYRIKTPRTLTDIAKEFEVPPANITIPGDDPKNAKVGDIVLIRNANVWSHKQGFSPDGPLLKDACNKVIKDPWKACKSYGKGLNYTTVCGIFCFKK